MEEKTLDKFYLIPASIILAGIIIAGAIYQGKTPIGNGEDNTASAVFSADLSPISADEHIFGNPNAPVKIIEFSDLECIFCKRFHFVLKNIMSEYSKDGKVALVFRHYPLESLHSKAKSEAHASECIAEIGGNAKFWQYIDKIFTITPSNDGLDPKILGTTAHEIGIDIAEFEDCQKSGKYYDKITRQTEEAISSGGDGTPWSIIITRDGTQIPVSGALPFETIKILIDKALSGEPISFE